MRRPHRGHLKQDVFVSHASTDKHDYVMPLTRALTERDVTFWFGDVVLRGGDSIIDGINDGLRECRFILLCLSRAYVARQWTLGEMKSALASEYRGNQQKVLPLILNNMDEILDRYPILGDRKCLEWRGDPEAVADQITQIVHGTETDARLHRPTASDQNVHIQIESIHTGLVSSVRVAKRANVGYLLTRAQEAAGLKSELDTGGVEKLRIRWVLVDARAEDAWQRFDDSQRQKTFAVVMSDQGVRVAEDPGERLETLRLREDTIFHLHAVPLPRTPTGGGGGGGFDGVRSFKGPLYYP